MPNRVETCARFDIPVEILLDNVTPMRVHEAAAVAPFYYCVVLIISRRVEYLQHLFRVVLHTHVLSRVRVSIETLCVAVIGDCIVANHALLLGVDD